MAGRAVAYVVEGPFDWLAAVHWGLPAFAICGTHFPIDRLPALSAAVAIYGVFDPDRAGQSAAERFAPQIGTRWRPIRLPNGLDLAELAALGETGRETFRVLVGRARAAAWQGLARLVRSTPMSTATTETFRNGSAASTGKHSCGPPAISPWNATPSSVSPKH